MRSEHERRTAQHDAKQDQTEWAKQADADRSKRAWEGRKEHDNDEDDPDMIGFPDRTHRAVDRHALLSATRPKREKLPDATTKVGARKDGICAQTRDQREGCKTDEGGISHPSRPGPQR